MAPVSQELHEALSSLSRVIAQAEAKLQKMPGYTKAGVTVDLDGTLDWTGGAWLIAGTYAGECRLALSADGESVDSWVDELPVAARMQVAAWIPELIDSARAAEADVAKEINDIVGQIEQALSQD